MTGLKAPQRRNVAPEAPRTASSHGIAVPMRHPCRNLSAEGLPPVLGPFAEHFADDGLDAPLIPLVGASGSKRGDRRGPRFGTGSAHRDTRPQSGSQ